MNVFTKLKNSKKLSQPKKRLKLKKKTIGIISGITIIAVCAGVILFRKYGSGTAMAEQQSLIQSTTVQNGNIASTIESTGVLANGESDAVYAPSGIEIEEVLVQAGDQVAAGDILATVEEISLNAELYTAKEALSDLDDEIDSASSGTAAYYQLLKEQKDLKETYSILVQISEYGGIIAESDGIVSAVNISIGSDSSSDSSSDNAASAMTGMSSSSSSDTALITLSTADISISSISLELAQPAVGTAPTDTINGTVYTGKISWNPSGAAFKNNTVYTAEITITAKDGYALSKNTKIEVPNANEVTINTSAVEEEGIIVITAKFAATQTSSEQTSNQTESTSGTTAAPSSDTNSTSGNEALSGSGSQMSGSGISNGGVSASGSAVSGTSLSGSDSSTASTSSDNSELTTAFEITSGESMTLTVTIDELDILSLSEGQKAVVTLDAIENEKFEGEITYINTSGTSNGGTTKYEAEVTLSKNESMLAGMNASVSIVTEESGDDSLYIPALALQEDGTRTFVYTIKDDNTEELSGEVEVEIGSSDGSNIEIISGLSEGDTIYYELVSSSDSEESFDFPGGMDGIDIDNLPNGGEMPSGGMPGGGEMPSGGMPGGGGM